MVSWRALSMWLNSSSIPGSVSGKVDSSGLDMITDEKLHGERGTEGSEEKEGGMEMEKRGGRLEGGYRE